MSRPKRRIFFSYFAFLGFLAFGNPGPLCPAAGPVNRAVYDDYFQVRRLWSQRQYGEALARSRELIEGYPSLHEIYPVFAQLSKAAGWLEEAERFLHRLVKDKGGNPYFFYGLAVCCAERKDIGRATDYYKAAIREGADFIWPYYYLVMLTPESGWEGLKRYFAETARSYPQNSFLYYGLGVLYENKAKDFPLALDSYERALTAARESGRPADEAKHLNTIGNYHWARNSYPKALEYYEKALEVNEKYGDKSERARFLGNSGIMHCYMGNPLRGRECYERALSLDRDTGQKIHEAAMLRGIGFTHYRRSEYKESLSFYAQALRLARDYADKQGEGRYLTDLATSHWAKGDYPEAIPFYRDALAISRELGDQYNQIVTLNSLGNTYWTIGDFSKALEHEFDALKISRETGNRVLRADCLNSIGLIFQATGDYDRALEHFQSALGIRREVGNKSGEGVCLNNIGVLFQAQKKYAESLSPLEDSLKLAREGGEKKSIGNRLNNLALACGMLSRLDEALARNEESLEIARSIGDPEGEILALRTKGLLCLRRDDNGQALALLEEALCLARATGLSKHTWRILSSMGEANEKLGDLEKAAASYQKSIETAEGLRGRLQSEEQRSGFLGSAMDVFEKAVNVLYVLHQREPQAGHDRDCLAVVEKAKARAFLDGLEEARVDLRAGLTAEQRDEEGSISLRIAAIQTEIVKPGLPESRRGELLRDLEKAEADYSLFIQKMRGANPGYANLVSPETLSLERIQGGLPDERTAVCEYFVGEDTAYIFFITRNGFSLEILPDGQKLQEKAGDYIKLLSTREASPGQILEAGQSLYQELLGKVKGSLGPLVRLIFVPDGRLHYLPFEALALDNAPGRFLVEKYRVSYAPSASSLLYLRERRRGEIPEKALLAFADPLNSIGKKSSGSASSGDIMREFYLQQGYELPALPYSREEIKTIGHSLKAGRKEMYTGEKAKEEMVKSLSLQDYRIIHFATHGLVDTRVPMRSAVVLSLDADPREDGFFQAREILQVRLNADLVVLSACQSGRGKLEKGEGVSGLARAFFHAGAQSVLATLWNINDKATSRFMGGFYDSLSLGKDRDEALQLAKIRFLRSEYSHPFYWAAFVLNGDFGFPVREDK
jgi:CHAT domain-containing protein/Tfp pilus assembly protein PilF